MLKGLCSNKAENEVIQVSHMVFNILRKYNNY